MTAPYTPPAEQVAGTDDYDNAVDRRSKMIADLVAIGKERKLASGKVTEIIQKYIVRGIEPRYQEALRALDALQPPRPQPPTDGDWGKASKQEEDRQLALLRSDAQKIVADCDLKWDRFMVEGMPKIGSAHTALMNATERQLYLDRVATEARRIKLADMEREGKVDASEERNLKDHQAQYTTVTDYLRTQWEKLGIVGKGTECQEHLDRILGKLKLPDYLAQHGLDKTLADFKAYFAQIEEEKALAALDSSLLNLAGNPSEAPASVDHSDQVIEAEVIPENATAGKIEPQTGQPVEPTLEQIKVYRDAADKMIRDAHPTAYLQSADVAKIHDEATGATGAKAALKKHGSFEVAIAKVQEHLAKIAPEVVVESKPTALAIVEKPAQTVEMRQTWNMPTTEQWNLMNNLARSIAASGFYATIDTYEKAIVIMMKGFSLGLDPMSALDGIDVIEDNKGRKQIFYRAKLLKALVHKTGKCRRFDVTCDGNRAVAVVQREGDEPHTYTYSLEDAQQARLVNGDGTSNRKAWSDNPKKMLTWRVVHTACSIEFPEVTFVVDDEAEAA